MWHRSISLGKRVALDDGRADSYDKLLLATGAHPIKLDLPGAKLPHVHYLRTLSNSRASWRVRRPRVVPS